ncbi:MAG: hypothetical protein CVU05_07050 [Bacteroidetes bacterium HGW-Bacteroidetes-21]|nr:MAG: hypothetical protein CVU05_07050 [Bacteroidetes bacterium HGW-Bacteroidetes-21]
MKHFVTFLILLLLADFTFSQPAGKEKFSLHLSLISENGKIKTREYKSTDSSEIKSIIETEIATLHNKGFLLAYDSTFKKDHFTTCKIFAGCRYKAKTDSVFIKKDSLNTLFYSLFKNSKYYSYSATLRQKENLVKTFENTGYPFISVTCDSLIFDNQSIGFRYIIDKGPLILYDSISLHGDVLVKSKFLMRYLQLPSGTPYSEKNIQAIPRRLSQTGFLESSRSPDLWFGKDKARINIYLKKKKANKFEGIAGIIPPPNDSSKLSVTGEVTLYLVNTLHHADKFSLHWKKYDAEGQLLDAEFMYPYLFNFPAGMDLKFNLLKKDTSYINTLVKVGVPYFFSGNNFAGLKYEQKTTRVLTKTPSSSTANINLNSAGLYFYWNNFDRIMIPRKGLGIEAEVMTGKKEIKKPDGEKSNEDYFSQHLQMSYHFPVAKNFGIKTELQHGLLSGKTIFENELMRIGGYKTLRGFDEESMSVQRYVSGLVEFKAFFGEYSNTFLFFNAASYYKNISEKINDSPYGFGWGIEIETPAGVLSLMYALGKQFDNPIELRNSRVHISLVNAF